MGGCYAGNEIQMVSSAAADARQIACGGTPMEAGRGARPETSPAAIASGTHKKGCFSIRPIHQGFLDGKPSPHSHRHASPESQDTEEHAQEANKSVARLVSSRPR